MNDLIVIAGPTATGKTSSAIKLAKMLNTEIVSADSMQIYKFMDIGTAKVTIDEMQGVPHHMIDIISPTQNYNLSDYSIDANKCIGEIVKKGKNREYRSS